ncbi:MULTISPECIES: hypothetical protein [unclassified Streptomyces]|uniref:hypothetical protein n=1 Tax=unclassified Streptomyces TaxID=2593676 RepID=UPI000AA116BF|nr:MULTISPECIES: hypothetical protein [unclassified Streptomyces]AZM63613.1 hypothetical protein DLM49_32185 [Streptomyces sp. WAC 01438]RSM93007.1 hypothetical protein DMA10_22795 [Streptomyces sp. WAC 01420]
MAGTDEQAVAADDDALYVLTAALLTPAKFPSVLGDDYPEACAALGLPPVADGYGLVLGQDGEGARWTVVIDDVSLVAVAIASWDCGMEHDLSPDERTVVAALPGWPLAVAVAAPNVPAPHDPAPDVADGPALRPPDAEVWGPAQRRLGADEIALQWATWREQVDDAAFPAPGGPAEGADGPGETAADNSDGADGAEDGRKDGEGDGGAPRGGHAGIRRVLAEARAYVDSPPPLGRVRSSFAPGGARTLRADGPGWSLVARTDDIAFVLLDDEPGEVLPVGRGPELPGLLEALDQMAVRPL